MNERQIIFLLGAVLGGVAGGCWGFAGGMKYVMDDEERNQLLRFEGWLDGIAVALKLRKSDEEA